MTVIAIGGFQHETNTFSPHTTPYSAFVEPDCWPGLLRGQAILEKIQIESNIPIAGFLQEALGERLLPLTWCGAVPGGIVEKSAFDRITAMLCQDLVDNQVDAVYLDLHGAMVSEGARDGEVEIIRRIRAMTGDMVPIICSLDFHANVSRTLFELTNALVGYKTYPHIDMADTGARAYELMCLYLQGRPVFKAYKQLDFLVPLTAQCTLLSPAADIFAALDALETKYNVSLTFTMGFPLADFSDTGPAIMAYGLEQLKVDQALHALEDVIRKQIPNFKTTLYSPEEALTYSMAKVREKPIVWADTQDNPGAGGTSDTTDAIKALTHPEAPVSYCAILCDPESAAAAHAAGEGSLVTLRLGAKSNLAGQTPIEAEFEVIKLSEGNVLGTGAYFAGCLLDLGISALVKLNHCYIVISSVRFQCADQALFTHFGLNLNDADIIVVKSSVHFRADFTALADEIIHIEAPGLNIENLKTLTYQHLRPGVTII